MLDKIKGGLIGLAIGDAMGVATEFMSPEEIKDEYGVVTEILGGGVFGFDCGETSDDTAMTIAVARGIIANSYNPIEEIGKEFIKWKATNPTDIGITIRNAFRNYKGDWFEAAIMTHQELGQSGGNGTLMRCLPIALAYSNIEKADEISVLQSKMTHYEESAAEACVIYNRIARRLLHGEDLEPSILTEIKNTEYDIDYRTEPNCPADGYVVHTMKWVLYWLLNCDSFNEVILGATNMGGDSDTIAAIAGGLKGIEVGYNKLPDRHKDQLLNQNLIEEMAEVIYAIRDKDTLEIKKNQENYLQGLIAMIHQHYSLAEQEFYFEEPAEMIEALKMNVYLYRASLQEDHADFLKKYQKWWNVRARFRRSKRLVELRAPAIIIQNELFWLKTEIDHLDQIQKGIEPQYTSEELEELENMRQMEKVMEEEPKYYQG